MENFLSNPPLNKIKREERRKERRNIKNVKF
jgi:hypothetical protein